MKNSSDWLLLYALNIFGSYMLNEKNFKRREYILQKVCNVFCFCFVYCDCLRYFSHNFITSFDLYMELIYVKCALLKCIFKFLILSFRYHSIINKILTDHHSRQFVWNSLRHFLKTMDWYLETEYCFLKTILSIDHVYT